jgi:hypothetical protein
VAAQEEEVEKPAGVTVAAQEEEVKNPVGVTVAAQEEKVENPAGVMMEQPHRTVVMNREVRSQRMME